jgi:hypothetical protein
LHHPFDSFDPVVEFVSGAAKDPKVLAIKMCLYRTGKNSPIPQALIEASEHGKQVTDALQFVLKYEQRGAQAGFLHNQQGTPHGLLDALRRLFRLHD